MSHEYLDCNSNDEKLLNEILLHLTSINLFLKNTSYNDYHIQTNEKLIMKIRERLE